MATTGKKTRQTSGGVRNSWDMGGFAGNFAGNKLGNYLKPLLFPFKLNFKFSIKYWETKYGEIVTNFPTIENWGINSKRFFINKKYFREFYSKTYTNYIVRRCNYNGYDCRRQWKLVNTFMGICLKLNLNTQTRITSKETSSDNSVVKHLFNGT